MARDRSPFQISVLMPAWIVRTVFMLVPLVLCIVFLAIFANTKDALSKAGVTFANRAADEVIGILAASIAFIALCYILDAAAVILYATHKLSARLFLIFSAIQMVLWLAVLVLAIILGTWAITAFVLIVFFFFLGILVYASMIFHKDRKEDQRGDYEKTVANEKMPAVGHFAQNPSSLSVMSGAIQQRYDTMPGNRDSSASYTSYH